MHEMKAQMLIWALILGAGITSVPGTLTCPLRALLYFLYAVIRFKKCSPWWSSAEEVMKVLPIKPSGNISLSSQTSVTTWLPSSLQTSLHEKDDISPISAGRHFLCTTRRPNISILLCVSYSAAYKWRAIWAESPLSLFSLWAAFVLTCTQMGKGVPIIDLFLCQQ